MIKLIGTNHLQAPEEIKGLISKENPDIIGIELCEFREHAILNDLEKKENIGNSLLNKITSKIKERADKEGLDYGSDMKTALRYSVDNNLPRGLVDMPIMKIQELFNKIPINEQQGFMKELQEFESSNIKQEVDENLVLTNLKNNFPIAFEFLINMRNLYIANRILLIEKANPNKKIVVVLGKAHVEQVKKMIGI